MEYRLELEAALEAARRATAELRRLYDQHQAVADAPINITLDADRASQDLILETLSQRFPDDGFSAEERTALLARLPRHGKRLWVVDPIDGTRGFAQKNGQFSVMIALVHEGRPAVGVVAEPAFQRITYAAKGGGCWYTQDKYTEPRICRVTQTDSLGQAVLVQTHSKAGKTSPGVQALRPARVIETYSAGVKLALVARGEADIYLNDYPRFHDWDICAGHILVEEAGGKVTGLHGEQLHYGSETASQSAGLLGTNGRLHETALKAWRELPPA